MSFGGAQRFSSAIVQTSTPLSSKKSSLKKHRCWQFEVAGITGGGVASGKDGILAAFRERYTSVTRLTLKAGNNRNGQSSSSLCAEVQFSGPQPCEGPGALLCALLRGTSVQAKPVPLERGRKRTKMTNSCTFVDSGSQGRAEATARLPGTRTPVHERAKGEFDNCDAPRDAWIKSETTESITTAANKSSIGGAGAAHGDLGGDDLGELFVLPFDTAPVTSFEWPASDFSKGLTSDPCVPVEHIRLGCGLPVDRAQRSAETSYADPVSIRTKENDRQDFERVLLAGGGPWGSDQAINACSPDAQPLGTWPLHSHQGQRETLSSSNVVTPALVWEDLMFWTEGVGGLLAGAESNSAAGTTTPGNDGREERDAMGDFDTSIPAEQVSVALFQKECDFEGICGPAPQLLSTRSPGSASPSNVAHIFFTGLESTGHDPRMLTATAHFSIDPATKVTNVASPFQMDTDGRMCAAVCYPSLQDIWPEVYTATNVRIVEVDVLIEVRSRNGEFEYVGPKHKVTYRRASAPAETQEASAEVPFRLMSPPSALFF